MPSGWYPARNGPTHGRPEGRSPARDLRHRRGCASYGAPSRRARRRTRGPRPRNGGRGRAATARTWPRWVPCLSEGLFIAWFKGRTAILPGAAVAGPRLVAFPADTRDFLLTSGARLGLA